MRSATRQPSVWQIPKLAQDSNGGGLAPAAAPWVYQGGGLTRSRTTFDAQKKPITNHQWLRWIHEATVVGYATEGLVPQNVWLLMDWNRIMLK